MAKKVNKQQFAIYIEKHLTTAIKKLNRHSNAFKNVIVKVKDGEVEAWLPEIIEDFKVCAYIDDLYEAYEEEYRISKESVSEATLCIAASFIEYYVDTLNYITT